MSNHTDGPWIWSTYEGNSGSFRVLSIAKAIHGSAGYVAKIPASKFHNEKANATLIAAAPDLLGALESVDAFISAPLSGYRLPPEIVADIRAAIAKARGKE